MLVPSVNQKLICLFSLQLIFKRGTIQKLNIYKGGSSRMANHKSAKKRIEISARQNLENKRVRSALKTQLKKFNAAVDANENVDALVKETISVIDGAASKGVIHKNAASRKKSQVAKKAVKA